MVQGSAFDLLWAHVKRRAHGNTDLREIGHFHVVAAHDAGEAEIGHFHLARRSDHDVLWLDVAVDHALLGGLAQRGSDLPHDRKGRLQQRRAVAGEPFAEVLTLHVFLNDVMQPLDVAHLVDLHDIGVDQRCCGLGLALETLQVDVVVGQFLLENLDGDPAFQRMLLGQIDLGHRPASQSPQEAEIAHLAAGKIGRRGIVR